MKHLVAALALLAAVGSASAQTLGTKPGPMQYPESMELWEVKTSLQMAFIKMPEAVVEEADTYRWPSWDIDAFIGMPENFLVNAKVTTQFINWHFQLGAKWQWAPSEKFRMYAGLDYAYFIGGIGAGAFDNSNNSTFLYPNISAGYDFEDFTLTFKGELNYLLSKQDKAGTVEISSSENIFNGVSGALYLEQPFWGDTQWIIAARANYLKFVYQNWLLFPSTDTFYFVPEFILGVRL